MTVTLGPLETTASFMVVVEACRICEARFEILLVAVARMLLIAAFYIGMGESLAGRENF